MAFLCVPVFGAEENAKEAPKDTVEIKSPSPDGAFAFLETVPAGAERREGTVDLIDAKTKKVLARVDDEIDVNWSVLWSPDSRKFAFTFRVNHPIQGMDLWVRSGKTFRKAKLPALEANIPEKIKRGHDYPHWAEMNYTTVERWNKDGTLTVQIESVIDGAGASLTATRRVVLGFDRAGKVEVESSRLKYGRGE
jgi:hypothetical protein